MNETTTSQTICKQEIHSLNDHIDYIGSSNTVTCVHNYPKESFKDNVESCGDDSVTNNNLDEDSRYMVFDGHLSIKRL